MKAIIYPETSAHAVAGSFIAVEREAPLPTGRELLVRVRAVAVNPVDVKSRQGHIAIATGGTGILGWDAAGIVEAVGPQARLFKPGDAVYYAGAIERAGANAELQVVDERIVGPKPTSLTFAAAAALPLTTLTAWEMLFDRFGLSEGGGEGEILLIVGAAGGVGSIALQLARRLTKFTVVATASRPQSAEWAKSMGAQHVIDHSQPFAQEFKRLGLGAPSHVFVTNGETEHFAQAAELVAPQGKLGFIVPPQSAAIDALFFKSIALHMEFMYTRSLYQTADIDRQHAILARVAAMVDRGDIITTQAEHLGALTPDNLVRAHALLETNRALGKIVLDGF